MISWQHDLSSMPTTYSFYGTMNNYIQLEQEGKRECGIIYNVLDTDTNFLYSGSEWCALGNTSSMVEDRSEYIYSVVANCCNCEHLLCIKETS